MTRYRSLPKKNLFVAQVQNVWNPKIRKLKLDLKVI